MSSDKDLAVSAIGAFKESPSNPGIPGIPNGPPAKVVPAYLVKLLPDLDSKKSYRFFIASGEAAFNNPNFVHVKGFFTDASEEDICSQYKEMVAGATTSQIVEMWFPCSTVHSIKSLGYKTNKK